ncbi:F-box/FBD/LRR-repeat protein At1g13570-like [Ipomoea triloba]|uniref:F-box/FBD/LRR-repeat protein At1g13570-like n=1 Tax=Ipomoea triloba TaxID=35885 RepID=UPI00125E8B2B|nr:F-box/FBD/LRR-repeat protein At1g13570-like [Ipomoea triloba]
MARRRQIKATVVDRSRDLISPLPVEIKHRILECLPTRDAARTAVLSTHWNDVWLQHGRLAFDYDFIYSVEQGDDDNYDFIYSVEQGDDDKGRTLVDVEQGDDDKGRTLVDIINNILLFRAGPVKKFTLYVEHCYRQSDLDRWCLFLSRNGVEELIIKFCNCGEDEYKLPFCILSCQTIKQMSVDGPFIDFPVNNVGGIFSNVTSLFFSSVEFRLNVNGTASSISISIPNLEKLSFFNCVGINKFEISASKLERLSVRYFVHDVVESRWLAPHLKAIKSLWLCGSSLLYVDASLFATTINLQVLGLYELRFSCAKQLTTAMQLLQKCPNVCELGIRAYQEVSKFDDEATSRLLKDPDGCFIVQDLKMLNTIKIESFRGSTVEILFVKMLLSKSPALEKVVIMESCFIDTSVAVKSLRELLRFPRASLKAQIVCMEHKGAMSGWAMGEL